MPPPIGAAPKLSTPATQRAAPGSLRIDVEGTDAIDTAEISRPPLPLQTSLSAWTALINNAVPSQPSTDEKYFDASACRPRVDRPNTHCVHTDAVVDELTHSSILKSASTFPLSMMSRSAEGPLRFVDPVSGA
ncbi:hypothetical protein B0H17DRAFT_1194006 [Mycena rosella]|uniref:Uncharacterized protein n=1 Tax=Mycena rosella TaxID=1033263 RepID=A0AAD7GS64_MYCRO|nr:hypothetical protein B0H17DRAFT_1194006 [Mycena rosella]